MNTIKTLIVDDEPRARSVIKNLLAKSCPQIDIVAEANSVLDAIEKIKRHNPQLIFLDVEMPNYAGYEIVNFLDEINFEIIFITAYDQYAIKAFEVCAVDYILKPIDRTKLNEAVEKVEKKLLLKNKLEHYQVLVDTLNDNAHEKMIIPELGNRRIINTREIIAIEANGAYTTIYMQKGNKITTSKNLRYHEKKLTNNKDFIRTHRSWLINKYHLQQFNKTENLLFMKGDIIAKITRAQYEKFEALLNL